MLHVRQESNPKPKQKWPDTITLMVHKQHKDLFGIFFEFYQDRDFAPFPAILTLQPSGERVMVKPATTFREGTVLIYESRQNLLQSWQVVSDEKFLILSND